MNIMKETNFLKKLKRIRKLELIEPSEEMKSAYLKKAENCLLSAKILLPKNLYENATSESYYCIYNSLLALFFKIGIKSENHSATIALFRKLFKKEDLYKTALWAKEERIDKQYYVETNHIIKLTKNSCLKMISEAEDFLLKLKVIIKQLNYEEVKIFRKSFEEL